MSWLDNQLQNRNFLSPVGFKFVLDKAPKTVFLCQSATIPGISIGSPEQPTPFKKIPLTGDVVYEDLTVSFLVDEDLENYLEIHNWLKSISAADDFQRYSDFLDNSKLKNNVRTYSSDGNMMILTSNYQYNFQIKYSDLFPITLSALEFNVGGSDIEYFTAQATFRYTIYNIETMQGEER